MDGGDEWRVGFHGGEVPEEKSSIIGRIMLRFRPIMPKPASAGTSTCLSHQDNKRVMLNSKRSKRKYVRICKNNNNPSSKRKELQTSSKTLQLMPEMDGQDCIKGVGHADRTAQRVLALETWVTVECVTDTFMDEGLGCTDEEKMRNLEEDECPGFISDCSHKVKFVNNAYKRFVSFGVLEDDENELNVGTCLVLKESLPVMYSAFSCRVKWQYSDKKCSKMVPCDVWRMDFGGFAWKLDIKAALSLGL